MRLLFIFFIFIAFTSCTKMFLKKYGAIGGKPELQKISMKNKDILFLGMIHVAEKPFYIQTKKLIDSLSNNGYYIFGEGVTLGKDTLGNQRMFLNSEDSLNSKKMRKILGFTLSLSDKNSTAFKLKQKYNLESQPIDLYFTRDNTKMEIVDATTKEMITYYESKRGEIKLDTCDIRTKVREDYTCQKLPKSERRFFMDSVGLKNRNKIVVDAVKKSNHKKILIIYGKKHFEGMKEGLEK